MRARSRAPLSAPAALARRTPRARRPCARASVRTDRLHPLLSPGLLRVDIVRYSRLIQGIFQRLADVAFEMPADVPALFAQDLVSRDLPRVFLGGILRARLDLDRALGCRVGDVEASWHTLDLHRHLRL